MIPLIDGSSFELKLSSNSILREGDKVRISTIKGQEYHKKGYPPIVRYNGRKESHEWQPVGDKYSLKELWDIINPGLFKEIDGNTAEVISVDNTNGIPYYSIMISFIDGSIKKLRLSEYSNLLEGDVVAISSIRVQEFHKKGYDPIVRYDGEFIV